MWLHVVTGELPLAELAPFATLSPPLPIERLPHPMASSPQQNPQEQLPLLLLPSYESEHSGVWHMPRPTLEEELFAELLAPPDVSAPATATSGFSLPEPPIPPPPEQASVLTSMSTVAAAALSPLPPFPSNTRLQQPLPPLLSIVLPPQPALSRLSNVPPLQPAPAPTPRPRQQQLSESHPLPAASQSQSQALPRPRNGGRARQAAIKRATRLKRAAQLHATAQLRTPTCVPPSSLSSSFAKDPLGGVALWRQRLSPGASASRYCHICGRASSPSLRMSVCHFAAHALCRKVVCVDCVARYDSDHAKAAAQGGAPWCCTHCRGVCPPRARCVHYRRNNERRRGMRAMAGRRRVGASSGRGAYCNASAAGGRAGEGQAVNDDVGGVGEVTAPAAPTVPVEQGSRATGSTWENGMGTSPTGVSDGALVEVGKPEFCSSNEMAVELQGSSFWDLDDLPFP